MSSILIAFIHSFSFSLLRGHLSFIQLLQMLFLIIETAFFEYGCQISGLPAPNNAITGVLKAAAICIGPVSTLINKSALLINANNSCNDSLPAVLITLFFVCEIIVLINSFSFSVPIKIIFALYFSIRRSDN